MMEIASPCIRNCCLDQNDICMGCFRHINEIMQWSSANQELKQQIMKATIKRKEEKEQRLNTEI